MILNQSNPKEWIESYPSSVQFSSKSHTFHVFNCTWQNQYQQPFHGNSVSSYQFHTCGWVPCLPCDQWRGTDGIPFRSSWDGWRKACWVHVSRPFCMYDWCGDWDGVLMMVRRKDNDERVRNNWCCVWKVLKRLQCNAPCHDGLIVDSVACRVTLYSWKTSGNLFLRTLV